MASGEVGGYFSERWYGDRGLLGGQMTLCRDRLGGLLWRERRGWSGFPPGDNIGRRNEKKGWD